MSGNIDRTGQIADVGIAGSVERSLLCGGNEIAGAEIADAFEIDGSLPSPQPQGITIAMRVGKSLVDGRAVLIARAALKPLEGRSSGPRPKTLRRQRCPRDQEFHRRSSVPPRGP